MSSLNKTPNGLNKWDENDYPKMEDFNADNEKLDALFTEKANYTSANLWRPSDECIVSTINGITISYDPETEEFTLNGSAGNSTSFVFDKLLPINLIEAQPYSLSYFYVSGNVSGSRNNIAVKYTALKDDLSTVFEKSISLSNAKQNAQITYAPNASDVAAKYLKFTFPLEYQVTYTNFKFKVQFEKGSPTTYQPQLLKTMKYDNLAQMVSPNLIQSHDINFPITDRGITFDYDDETEVYTVNGIASASVEITFTPYIPFTAKKDVAYSTSFDYISGECQFNSQPQIQAIAINNTGHNDNSFINYVKVGQSNYKTTYYNGNTAIRFLQFQFNVYDGCVFTNLKFKLQFEYGFATAWKPSIGLKQLSKIADSKRFALHQSPNVWRPVNQTFPITSFGATIDYDPITEIYTINGNPTSGNAVTISSQIPFQFIEGQPYTLAYYYISGEAQNPASNNSDIIYVKISGRNEPTQVFSSSIYNYRSDYKKSKIKIIYADTSILDTKTINLQLTPSSLTTYTNLKFKLQFEQGTAPVWQPSTCLTALVEESFQNNKHSIPVKDNAFDLGSATKRFKNAYLAAGVITTSDRRQKEHIKPLDETAMMFLKTLNPVSYSYTDGTSGRPHYGLIAQEVEAAMKKCGINDFAGLIKSPIQVDNIENQETDYIYGLRYDEFIALLIKAIQMQEARIAQLEQRTDL